MLFQNTEVTVPTTVIVAIFATFLGCVLFVWYSLARSFLWPQEFPLAFGQATPDTLVDFIVHSVLNTLLNQRAFGAKVLSKLYVISLDAEEDVWVIKLGAVGTFPTLNEQVVHHW
jgi:hypothetical protein